MVENFKIHPFCFCERSLWSISKSDVGFFKIQKRSKTFFRCTMPVEIYFQKTCRKRKMIFSAFCWYENRYENFDLRSSPLARFQCGQYSTMTSDIYGSKKTRKRNPDKFTRRIDIQIKLTLVEREGIQLSNDIKIIIWFWRKFSDAQNTDRLSFLPIRR